MLAKFTEYVPKLDSTTSEETCCRRFGPSPIDSNSRVPACVGPTKQQMLPCSNSPQALPIIRRPYLTGALSVRHGGLCLNHPTIPPVSFDWPTIGCSTNSGFTSSKRPSIIGFPSFATKPFGTMPRWRRCNCVTIWNCRIAVERFRNKSLAKSTNPRAGTATNC